MALDVSRFPDTVNIPTTVLYSDFSNDNRERESEAAAKKRKRTFPKLFGNKKSQNSKERNLDREVEQPYHHLRVKSFHPQRQPLQLSLPSSPQSYPPLERNRSIETSTPSRPTFSSARTKPKLAHLEIPQAIITKPRAQDDLLIPPTPKLKDISTKDTIRALGLTQPMPLARGPPTLTNPAIFSEGVPTFSSGLPSHFTGGISIPVISPPSSTNTTPYTAMTGDTPSSSLSAAPKSTPMSSPGSARPLPPIPKKQAHSVSPSPSRGPSPGIGVPIIPPGADLLASPRPLPPRNSSLDSGTLAATLPPRNGSLDSGMPAVKGRGRRLPPVPLVLAKHHHTKSVPAFSPPPSYEGTALPKDAPRPPAQPNVAAPALNPTAAAISKPIIPPAELSASAVTPDVVVHLPTPGADVDFQTGDRVVIRPSEESPSPDTAQSAPSTHASNSSSTIPFISSRSTTPMLTDPPPRQPSPELILGGLKPAPRRNGPPKAGDGGAWAWSPPQSWNGPDDVQPAPPVRGRKKDKKPGSAKGLDGKGSQSRPGSRNGGNSRPGSAKGGEEKRPGSAKGFFSWKKAIEDKEDAGILSQLNTVLQRTKTPDPWEDEDKVRSAVDSQPNPLWGDEAWGKESRPDTGNWIGLVYGADEPPAAHKLGEEDLVIMAATEWSEGLGEIELHDAILQLRDLKSKNLK